MNQIISQLAHLDASLEATVFTLLIVLSLALGYLLGYLLFNLPWINHLKKEVKALKVVVESQKKIIYDLEEFGSKQSAKTNQLENQQSTSSSQLELFKQKISQADQTITELQQALEESYKKSNAQEKMLEEFKNLVELQSVSLVDMKKWEQMQEKNKQLEEELRELKNNISPQSSKENSFEKDQTTKEEGILNLNNESQYDDFSKIEGVNQEINKQLHQMGLYFFKDLIHLTDDDGRELTEKLFGDPDRFEKNQWRAQAMSLHTEKKINKIL